MGLTYGPVCIYGPLSSNGILLTPWRFCIFWGSNSVLFRNLWLENINSVLCPLLCIQAMDWLSMDAQRHWLSLLLLAKILRKNTKWKGWTGLNHGLGAGAGCTLEKCKLRMCTISKCSYDNSSSSNNRFNWCTCCKKRAMRNLFVHDSVMITCDF